MFEKVTSSRELSLIANSLRRHIIEMLVEAKSGHPGGPLGLADIYAVLYFHNLRFDPKDPNWEDRDRVILSNGHVCPVLYATLAEAGFFPVSELKSLRKLGSRLQGHPHRGQLPGIENSSGPLGQGLSQAVGMALVAQREKKPWRVYAMLSDGEHNEGQTWEAIMLANKYSLGNLTVIIDRNFIQIDGKTEEVLPMEPFADKYRSFGWHVIEVDGHNISELKRAVDASANIAKPTVILARTIPGKGVSFMEHRYQWHGKAPNADEAKQALAELNEEKKRFESML
ncbi:MAG: transketolase [Candidatus Micrarchaeota archaeon]